MQSAFVDFRDFLSQFTWGDGESKVDSEFLRMLEEKMVTLFDERDNLPKEVIKQLVELYVTCGALSEGFSSPVKLGNELQRMLRLIQTY